MCNVHTKFVGNRFETAVNGKNTNFTQLFADFSGLTRMNLERFKQKIVV